MSEQQPLVKCPACGSTDVAAVPLSLIESRYFKCGVCVTTFREAARAQPVDTFRLDRDDPKAKK